MHVIYQTQKFNDIFTFSNYMSGIYNYFNDHLKTYSKIIAFIMSNVFKYAAYGKIFYIFSHLYCRYIYHYFIRT